MAGKKVGLLNQSCSSDAQGPIEAQY